MSKPSAHSADESVLIVEDDRFIREALDAYLTGEGFLVATAEDGTSMRTCLDQAVPSIVIMDLRLPGEDGIELTRYLRENYSLGIIILTTKSELVDRIVGLEVGADDYITKPYEPRELLARIRSLLRRLTSQSLHSGDSPETKPSSKPPSYQIGDCALSLERRCLVGSSGETVDLTTSEVRLLEVFVQNPSVTMSRDALMQSVYQREWSPLDRSIDVLVTKIRRKLDECPQFPAAIRSVRGVGYEFIANVSAGPD